MGECIMTHRYRQAKWSALLAVFLVSCGTIIHGTTQTIRSESQMTAPTHLTPLLVAQAADTKKDPEQGADIDTDLEINTENVETDTLKDTDNIDADLEKDTDDIDTDLEKDTTTDADLEITK